MAFLKNTIACIANGFIAGCCDVDGGMFTAIDVTHGSIRIVSRPGIPHADGEAEKIARLCWRMRCIDADCAQSSFIPHASDAVRSRSANIDTASAEKQHHRGATEKPEAAQWLGQGTTEE